MSENNLLTFEKLKWFISEGHIQGIVSNQWFNGLITKFPLEFLLLSQLTSNFNEKRNMIKIRFSDKVNLKIQKLLEYPLEEEDVDYLNSLSIQLDERISQKEKQLKN